MRPLGDLAEPLGVTRQGIYAAADKGYIGGTIRAGRSRKITQEAYEYHVRHGYGADVPPAGTAEPIGQAAVVDPLPEWPF